MKDPQLTEKNHEDMDQFLGHVLDYYKTGQIDKTEAVSTLAHVMAALDQDNYSEAINWFEQGRKWVLQKKQPGQDEPK